MGACHTVVPGVRLISSILTGESIAAYMMEVLAGRAPEAQAHMGNATDPLNSGDSFMDVYSPIKQRLIHWCRFFRIRAAGLHTI